MDPVPLIFSCDTEDYETPAADEAELLWARMFARHGIRACFCVVGEEARALRDRGRRDVLTALAGHEIASHSDMHSAHPTPAEYLEPLSWEEGVRRFLAEEGRGVRDLRDLLGQQPGAWCKPGNSWGAAVPYAAGLLGMPVFCDAPFEWAPGRPLRYAGGLLLRYHTSFDRYFNAPPAGRFEQMRADMEALLAQRQEEAGAEGRAPPGAIVMYTHPCRTLTAAFPSNFSAGKETPRGEWQPSPLRPEGEVQALRRDFDAFLRWIVELRANGRVVLTTYRELEGAHRLPPAPWLETAEVVALAQALAGDGASLEPRVVGGHALSPAEQLGLLTWALARRSEGGALPPEVPLRRLLGPIDADDDPQEEPAAGPGPAAGGEPGGGGRGGRRRERGLLGGAGGAPLDAGGAARPRSGGADAPRRTGPAGGGRGGRPRDAAHRAGRRRHDGAGGPGRSAPAALPRHLVGLPPAVRGPAPHPAGPLADLVGRPGVETLCRPFQELLQHPPPVGLQHQPGPGQGRFPGAAVAQGAGVRGGSPGGQVPGEEVGSGGRLRLPAPGAWRAGLVGFDRRRAGGGDAQHEHLLRPGDVEPPPAAQGLPLRRRQVGLQEVSLYRRRQLRSASSVCCVWSVRLVWSVRSSITGHSPAFPGRGAPAPRVPRAHCAPQVLPHC